MIITVVLAEDHQIVRQGLLLLLQSDPTLQVVGEASNGLEALSLAETLRPHILVTDVMMPQLNGLELLHQLKMQNLPTQTIVLSMYASEAYALQAFDNGARGYVLKDRGITDLLEAIRRVMAGGRFISHPLSEDRLAAYRRQQAGDTDGPLENLTPRQRQVLVLAAQGLNNPDIAARLSISRRTVEKHRAEAMRKLDLSGQTELVRFAVEHELLP
ncbi:MAG: response regulator transcription factor [Anaerolineae bacterium]